MQDDLVFSSFSPCGRVILCCDSGSLLILLYPLSNNGTYLCTQRLRLEPAAVGERRVVGGRRGEMPLLVGDVKSISVSIRNDDAVSPK